MLNFKNEIILEVVPTDISIWISGEILEEISVGVREDISVRIPETNTRIFSEQKKIAD